MKEKKKLDLTTWIMIGLIGGLIVGVIFNLFVPSGYFRDTIMIDGIFNVVGNGFIRLMKMLVVPLVFCSIVCGSSSIKDTKALGKIGGKALAFYLFTTAVAVTVAILISLVIRPGIGLDMDSIEITETTAAEDTSITDTILNIIPENPISSLADGEMLQIIFFALISGIVIAKLGEKVETVYKLMQQFNEIMMSMTMMVMKVAPIGVFCLIAKTFASLGYSGFVPLFKYMLSVTAGLFIQCLGIYMLLLFIFTKLNPFRFLKKFFPVMEFAFSTAASNATIPLNIETLESKIGVSNKISSFTIPLGATINMDGTSIMQGCAVVFAAQAYGIELGIGGYLTVIFTAMLASIGTAGIPSVGIITLSMVFNSVGLPVEAIAMIMGVDRILDMLRTAVNITGDAICTTIVASMNGELNRDIFYDKKTEN